MPRPAGATSGWRAVSSENYLSAPPVSEAVGRVGAVLGIAVALPLLAACGSGGGQGSGQDGTDALRLPTQPPTESADGMTALVGGKLDLEEETGCVVLVSDGFRYPVLWPTGTTAGRDPFRLRLPDGTIAREGDYVEGGGGYLSAGEGASVDDLGIPAECLEGPGRTEWGEVAVYNPNETVVVDESGGPIVHPAPAVATLLQPDAKALEGLTRSIEGVVEYRLETGCVLLAANGTPYSVVWPRGTRGQLDPFRIVLPDRTEVFEGDRVRGAGDVFAPEELAAFDGLPECVVEADEAWAFNHLGPVTFLER
jgi:hypothetical protein